MNDKDRAMFATAAVLLQKIVSELLEKLVAAGGNTLSNVADRLAPVVHISVDAINITVGDILTEVSGCDSGFCDCDDYDNDEWAGAELVDTRCDDPGCPLCATTASPVDDLPSVDDVLNSFGAGAVLAYDDEGELVKGVEMNPELLELFRANAAKVLSS